MHDDASKNAVKGVATYYYRFLRSDLINSIVGVAATFEMSSRACSTIKVENRYANANESSDYDERNDLLSCRGNSQNNYAL